MHRKRIQTQVKARREMFNLNLKRRLNARKVVDSNYEYLYNKARGSSGSAQLVVPELQRRLVCVILRDFMPYHFDALPNYASKCSRSKNTLTRKCQTTEHRHNNLCQSTRTLLKDMCYDILHFFLFISSGLSQVSALEFLDRMVVKYYNTATMLIAKPERQNACTM